MNGGVGFAEPDTNRSWAEDQGYGFELWSDLERTLALHYGAADSVSAIMPSRITRLLDVDGSVLLEYDDVSAFSGPADVLKDCEKLFSE